MSEQSTQKPSWICEFCYRPYYGDNLQDNWDIVWQSAVCPECQERVMNDGGYMKVVGGAYSFGADPRELTKLIKELTAELTKLKDYERSRWTGWAQKFKDTMGKDD